MRSVLAFDMDGALFDSHPVHRTAERGLLRAAGKEVSAAELALIFEGTALAEISRHFLGLLSPQPITLYAMQKDAVLPRVEGRAKAVERLDELLGPLKPLSNPMPPLASLSSLQALLPLLSGISRLRMN